jgi:hypothetical protein
MSVASPFLPSSFLNVSMAEESSSALILIFFLLTPSGLSSSLS